jgi:hypothetical protein
VHVRIDEGGSDQAAAQIDYLVGAVRVRRRAGVVAQPCHYAVIEGDRGRNRIGG